MRATNESGGTVISIADPNQPAGAKRGRGRAAALARASIEALEGRRLFTGTGLEFSGGFADATGLTSGRFLLLRQGFRASGKPANN
jgi:hypothetical protein